MLKSFKTFLNPKARTGVKSKSLSNLVRNTDGNMGMMLAGTIAMLIGGLALSIDLSNTYAARQRLQNTTDAIALLAARDGIEDRSELQAAAQAYFDQLYPNASGDRIEVLNISRNGDRVDIQTRNNIDMNFAQIFGYDNLDVTASSETVFAQQSLDVALVLDSTGSMQGTKLASLKTSATRLMNTFDDLNNDKLRVSIVPFAQYVNVGASQVNQPWLERNGVTGDTICAGSRTGNFKGQVEAGRRPIPAIPNAPCGEAIQPLTNDFRALKRTINNLEANGWTYAPAGLLWGWRTLDARAPFTQAASSDRGQKVLVLMTDGANTRSANGKTHEGRSQAAADNEMKRRCEQVKDSDIIVYTIAYEVDDTTTRNLLRNCASGRANFFNAQNASDLDAAFTNIAATLNELRITS